MFVPGLLVASVAIILASSALYVQRRVSQGGSDEVWQAAAILWMALTILPFGVLGLAQGVVGWWNTLVLKQRVLDLAAMKDEKGREQSPLFGTFIREDEGGLIVEDNWGRPSIFSRDAEFRYVFSPGEDVIAVYAHEAGQPPKITARFFWGRPTVQSAR